MRNPAAIGSVSMLYKGRWHKRLAGLFLAALAISIGFADTTTDRILLPIEVLGANGTTVSRTVALQAGQAESVRSLWLQIHGLRYADQASVQINTSTWIPLNNNTVTIAEPGRSYGGIGGGFSTLVMTLPLQSGAVVGGDNTIRFRFNQTDGVVSSYRVLALNFLTVEGKKILPPDNFVEDAPETWTPPLPDAASILAGRELWQTASLVASSLPDSPRIQAHCADCHAQDGRDLKYFNFSNASIVARARFHGLSTLQSEQIASYIRSLPLPQSWPPVEPSVPTWTRHWTSNRSRTGRQAPDSPGSSTRIRTHCRIWFDQHGDGANSSGVKSSGNCCQPP